MKHKYTAKIYFENDEVAENSADDIQQLITWMHNEAKTRSSDINGEIFDNTTHRIVKNIQYNPFEK